MVGGGISDPAAIREHLLRVGQLGAHARRSRAAPGKSARRHRHRQEGLVRGHAKGQPERMAVAAQVVGHGAVDDGCAHESKRPWYRAGGTHEGSSLQESRNGSVRPSDPIDERRWGGAAVSGCAETAEKAWCDGPELSAPRGIRHEPPTALCEPPAWEIERSSTRYCGYGSDGIPAREDSQADGANDGEVDRQVSEPTDYGERPRRDPDPR